MVNLELSRGGRVIVQRSMDGVRLGVQAKGKKKVNAEVVMAKEEFASLMAGGKEMLKGKAPDAEDPNQGKLFP